MASGWQWEQLISDMIQRSQAPIKALCETDFRMCRHMVGLGTVTSWDLARLHGAKKLFEPVWLLAFNSGWVSVADWIVAWLLGEHGPATSKANRRMFEGLDKIGSLLLDAPTPWAAAKHRDRKRAQGWQRKGGRCGFKLQGSALFGAFALTAAVFEIEDVAPAPLSAKGNELIDAFRTTYLARFTPQSQKAVQAELQGSGLSGREVRFCLDWSGGKISLVDKVIPEQLPLVPDSTA